MYTLSVRKITLWLFLILVPQSVIANETDKTLSPYFKIIGENIGNVEALPLQSTSADVDIAGVIADVRVKQVYQNRGQTPIEAIYIFPASTRAAVYAMKMTIGERVVVAKVEERQAAKQAYIKAKQEGKRASLLEQQRPNVFQMNVANIMPNDKIVVELSYTELLIPDNGVYEFVYPSVVAPRYSETPAANAPDTEAWVQNPYLQENSTVSAYSFDINVELASGIPIQSLQSISHEVDINYLQKDKAKISLKPSQQNSGNRDYILHYQLQGGSIESGLLLQKGEKENFFLMMMQPPKRVKVEKIPAREYIFVVDVSGSMHGFPLNTSKQLMKDLLTNLRPTDSFNILFFSGGARKLAGQSLMVTEANIQRAVAMMERLRGSGGTRLLPALKEAMSLPAAENVSRSFVIVTDGYVSVETEAFDFVRDNLNRANFFAFGIGSSVNRFLIEGLARAGRGEAFIITKPAEAAQTANRFRQYIESPLLTGIKVKFDGLDVYDVEPQQAPDLFAEKPLIVYGKWRGAAEGKINISGYQGDAVYQKSIDVNSSMVASDNQALRYLWARHRIAELGDYMKVQASSERKAEITTLGLTYNLLTAYTSFIAIDEEIVNPKAKSKTVKQALPLPQHVSNLAIGGKIASSPEPEMMALLLILGLLGLWTLLKNRVNFSRSFASYRN